MVWGVFFFLALSHLLDMELEPSAQPAVHGAGLLDKGLLSSSDASTITGTHFHKSWTLSIFIVLITTHLLPSLYHAALSVVWFAYLPLSIPMNHWKLATWIRMYAEHRHFRFAVLLHRRSHQKSTEFPHRGTVCYGTAGMETYYQQQPLIYGQQNIQACNRRYSISICH